MKIAYTTDLHGNRTFCKKLLDHPIKHIIIGGDICPHGRSYIKDAIGLQREFLADCLIPLIKKSNKHVLIMMGNDDFRVNMDLLEKAEKQGILKLMHNKLNKLNKTNIIGYSFVPEMPFLLKDWEKLDNKDSKLLTDPRDDVRSTEKEPGTIEQDLKKLKKLSKPKNTIYIIHTPPYNTKLDMIQNGSHVGSKSVKKFIEKEQPLLTLHGHIHESFDMSGEWKEKIGKTVCINPGSDPSSNELRIVEVELENLSKIELIKI